MPSLTAIATRLGEISSLWHNLYSLGRILRDYLVHIWQSVFLLWHKCFAIGQGCIVVDGQIVYNN